MGSRGSGIGFPSPHGTKPRAAKKTGPVSSSNKKWGSPAAFAVVPISWSCGHAVFVRFSGCSSSPEHLLFKPLKTSWEARRRTWARGNHGGGSGDCSRGLRMRLFDGLFKSLKR
ncbi:hypothetical protein GWK47_053245 [Chionoecetes opilio]|uniref:Uncharacterized protein n=1 Tax=Chionoecetes opilio TaxID=41210 RepID=A0A8J4XZP0_CHIOP|nr:hypothetical protein GWK47_053245 [Chionoecetes opilio]